MGTPTQQIVVENCRVGLADASCGSRGRAVVRNMAMAGGERMAMIVSSDYYYCSIDRRNLHQPAHRAVIGHKTLLALHAAPALG